MGRSQPKSASCLRSSYSSLKWSSAGERLQMISLDACVAMYAAAIPAGEMGAAGGDGASHVQGAALEPILADHTGQYTIHMRKTGTFTWPRTVCPRLGLARRRTARPPPPPAAAAASPHPTLSPPPPHARRVARRSFLIFFMQVGFVALEMGSGRAKNVRNILLKNLVDVMLAAMCWWAVGYAFAYGNSAGGVIG